MSSIIITLADNHTTREKKIVSPELNSLEDICAFVKEQCEAGMFDGPDNDDGEYTGRFELSESRDNQYEIIIGRHESESRTNCRVERFSKDASLKDMATAIIKAVPESDHLDISID